MRLLLGNATVWLAGGRHGLADVVVELPRRSAWAFRNGKRVRPLRIFRLHRGLTLDALAAAIGVTKGFLSQVENGHKNLSVDVLKKAAAALEVDIDDLV